MSVYVNQPKGFFTHLLLTVVSGFMGYVLADFIVKNNKTKIQSKALSNLNKLAGDLYQLEVKTTGELLRDSKSLESHYKFKFIDNKPVLKQQKYITIPLTIMDMKRRYFKNIYLAIKTMKYLFKVQLKKNVLN